MALTIDRIRELLFGRSGSPGDVYTKGSGGSITPVDPGTIGITDHGALTGLADDDHTQYAIDAGTSTTNGLVKFSNTDGRTLADTTLTSTGGGLYVPSNLSVDGNASVLGSLGVSGGTSGISTLPSWHVNGTLTGVIVANWSGTAGSGTAALAANRLYFMPLLIPARKPTIDQLLFEVTVVGTGSVNARIGMYAATSSTDWTPSGAPLADSGSIAVGATGGSTGVKTYSVSIQPNPGLMYWLAIGSSGAVTVRTIGSNGYYQMPVDPTNLSTRRYGLQVASWTYGTLPTSPTVTWLTSATVVPLLAVRCSA